jgi:hypothetical protein
MRRRAISSFRLHPSSLQFALPPLASNDLLGVALRTKTPPRDERTAERQDKADSKEWYRHRYDRHH